MEEMAAALSFARASSYQYYESPTGYARDRLPRHILDKLKGALVGKGEPPITDADIDAVNSDIAPHGKDAMVGGRSSELKLIGAQADAVRLLLQQSYGIAFTRLPAFNLAVEAEARTLAARKSSKRFEYLPSSWLNQIANTGSFALVKQAGSQMEPTIGDGDWMLFDWSASRVTFPGIYVLSYGDDFLVGRVQRDPETKGLIVTMDNKAYQPLRIPSESDAAVIGRLLWVGRHF